MSATLRILGTAAGPGIPSFYCHCAACEEARSDPRYRRTRTGLCLHLDGRQVLIDASPDLRSQLLRAGIDHIDRVWLSHWHADHYQGLPELEYFVRLLTRENVPLVLPPQAEELFLQTFPDLADIFTLSRWQFFETYREGEVALTPLPAEHGIETAGFLIETARTRVAYFPDTNDQWAAAVKERVRGVDYLICDASFHGDNWFPHAHMNTKEAIALSHELEAKHTLLTHLALHYADPISTAGLREELKNEDTIEIALDDMLIAL